MIVGGNPTLSDVEVINLSGDGQTCSKPANSPLQRSSTGIYIDGSPLICGGLEETASSSKCYKYNVQVNLTKQFT